MKVRHQDSPENVLKGLHQDSGNWCESPEDIVFEFTLTTFESWSWVVLVLFTHSVLSSNVLFRLQQLCCIETANCCVRAEYVENHKMLKAWICSPPPLAPIITLLNRQFSLDW